MLRLHARHVAESNLSARLHRELRQLQAARPAPKTEPAQPAVAETQSEPMQTPVAKRPKPTPTPTNPPPPRHNAPQPHITDEAGKPPLPLAA
jgi:hypothetical protein